MDIFLKTSREAVATMPTRSANPRRFIVNRVRRIVFASLLVVGLGTAVGYSAPSSHNVYYQAQLLDNVGNPVNTVTPMTFHIYDDIVAGTSLWNETQPTVEVVAGLFSVYLGEVNTLLPSIFAGGQNRYLGIAIGGDSEMVPRTLIAAVPSAMRAGIADDVIDDAIGESKLKGKSVSQEKINDKAVGRGQMEDKAVGRGQLDDGSVGALQIEDAAIAFADIGQNSATTGQVMKWNGTAWVADIDNTGASDGDWTIIGNAIYTAEDYGIARAGATLNGQHDSTHVNLGIDGITGEVGLDIKYATVAGGLQNSATAEASTVGGGENNEALGNYSVVGGGQDIRAFGTYSTVSGGYLNQADNDMVTIGGGQLNFALGSAGTIGGGESNTITVSSNSGTIAGGESNSVTADYGSIGGGILNEVQGDSGTVAGGRFNRVYAIGGTIGGGGNNSVNNNFGGTYGTVSGGRFNSSFGAFATVAGGEMNEATGNDSFIAGGRLNEASGESSFAAGFRAIAKDDGSFVWSSGNSGPVTSGGSGHFVANAEKFWFGDDASVSYTTNRLIETSTGAYLSTTGTWQSVSDVGRKENFSPISGEEILEQIAELPISKWNYKNDPDQHQHIGPTAQDFKAVFEVGEDDKTISALDPSGVALAGVQELYRQNQALKLEVAELKALVKQLLDRNQQLPSTTPDN